MNEVHLGQTGHTQEELMKEEQAQAHALQKWLSVIQKKEKKKKKEKEVQG